MCCRCVSCLFNPSFINHFVRIKSYNGCVYRPEPGNEPLISGVICWHVSNCNHTSGISQQIWLNQCSLCLWLKLCRFSCTVSGLIGWPTFASLAVLLYKLSSIHHSQATRPNLWLCVKQQAICSRFIYSSFKCSFHSGGWMSSWWCGDTVCITSSSSSGHTLAVNNQENISDVCWPMSSSLL